MSFKFDTVEVIWSVPASILSLIHILLLSLAGCGQSTANAKPTNTMEAFYDLLIRQDTSAMTDLGIDSKERCV